MRQDDIGGTHEILGTKPKREKGVRYVFIYDQIVCM